MSGQEQDVNAVRAAMERYVDAVANARADVLEELFHPQAAMIGYLGDRFLAGTPEPFLNDIATHPPMAGGDPPFKTEISAIEVTGRVARAQLREWAFFGTTDFVNYFHLALVDGEWKIVTKTFASL